MDERQRRDGRARPRGRRDRPDADRSDDNDRATGRPPASRGIPWCRLIDEKGRKYTPWILLRFNDTDMGLRPIPPNTPFWISPDIWVESSDPLGSPVAGEPNYVHARVINLGKAPAYPTRVQFYWANPALGLGAGTMNLIGTEWAYVPAHASLDVRCNTPWVPVLVNGGHECLMVNSSAPMLDPITQPFQPRLDRHVGQRNVMVIAASAGQLISITLAAHQLFPMRTRTEFTARVHHVMLDEKAFHDRDRSQILNALAAFGQPRTNTAEELMARYMPGTPEARLAHQVAPAIARIKPTGTQYLRAVEQTSRSAARISARLTDRISYLSMGETLGTAGRLLAATDTLRPESPQREVLLHAADLDVNEHRTLEVEFRVPDNAARGEFVIMHIVQRTEAGPIGGYTMIAAIEGG